MLDIYGPERIFGLDHDSLNIIGGILLDFRYQKASRVGRILSYKDTNNNSMVLYRSTTTTTIATLMTIPRISRILVTFIHQILRNLGIL